MLACIELYFIIPLYIAGVSCLSVGNNSIIHVHFTHREKFLYTTFSRNRSRGRVRMWGGGGGGQGHGYEITCLSYNEIDELVSHATCCAIVATGS